MIVENCEFDPIRDLTPVDQYGFIDLKTALDSSIVPSQLPDSETDYNGIENPEQVVGRPRDVFEAIDAMKAYEQVESSASADEKSE